MNNIEMCSADHINLSVGANFRSLMQKCTPLWEYLATLNLFSTHLVTFVIEMEGYYSS